MAISHSNTITPSPLFPSKKGVLELVTLKIIRTSAFPYSLLNGLIVLSRKIVCEGTKFSENSRYNNSSSLKIMTHILKNLFKEPFELAFKWKLGLLLQVILHLYVTIIGSFFGSVHSRFSLSYQRHTTALGTRISKFGSGFIGGIFYVEMCSSFINQSSNWRLFNSKQIFISFLISEILLHQR